MPEPTILSEVPSYRRHKPTSQVVVALKADDSDTRGFETAEQPVQRPYTTPVSLVQPIDRRIMPTRHDRLHAALPAAKFHPPATPAQIAHAEQVLVRSIPVQMRLPSAEYGATRPWFRFLNS